ncbi:MAG: ATP-dependent helicase [Nocardioidaceae bacterium]
MAPTYRLDRAARPLLERPALDDGQRRVVDHRGGPLLVLAGPGTGKTTTLVEAVVDRIQTDGLSPDEMLVLTFSRKAAEELRNRIVGRLGRTTATPISSTFHSFGYGLVRQWQPAEFYAAPLRLLSAPEQDVQLRELLSHSHAGGLVDWPAGLNRALATRGFAREVHAVLARARELGMEPADLVQVGSQSKRPEWVAAGAFMHEYLTVLDFEGALDYSELIHRAVLLAETPEVQRQLRSDFKAVFVDEYQDTDPSQVRLLTALAGDGRDLVVVGDPDQSIYAFRGADVRGILEFPDQFRTRAGDRATVVALDTTRRFGPRLLAASRRVAAGIGMRGAIDRATFDVFRRPRAVPGDYGAGSVQVMTFSSSGAECDHIADILRRSHLEDRIPWSQMAVLVRSGVTSIPGLRRALVGAGVPVEVAGDEVPIHTEPAVQPLLTALRAAIDPKRMTSEHLEVLLGSPLVGIDAAQLRKLGRALRSQDRALHPERLSLPSTELLRRAVVDPTELSDVDDRLAAGVLRCARLLQRAHRQLDDGAPAEEALWTLWSGTRWPRRLRAQVDAGGAAARAAQRDLDAIVALFELAARSEEKQGHRGALVFLEEVQAQQIPGDTLAERGVRGDAVRLLTAHRSKGLEWELVVVAGVQEQGWPDLRSRGTLLQADQLGRHDAVEPTTSGALLAEERRLFYVAVTRARHRLVVTAVASPEADGPQPSRLLDTLGVPVIERPGRPARPLSLAGVVSELRRTASDRSRTPALRAAAAARLARLAEERLHDEQLVPAADPSTWWGLRPRTHSDSPVRPDDEPLRISASALGAILDCPMRWFLAREAAGESSRAASLGFGSIVHALADHVAKSHDVSEAGLLDLLDPVWGQLHFESPWIAQRERVEAERAISRFARWHNRREHRSYVGSEVPFDVEVALEGGETARLSGCVDRVESDNEDRVVIVDFKTGKHAASGTSLAENPQLGLYQLAVDNDAFVELVGPGAESGGAELVQLRIDASGAPKVQVQPPQKADASGRKPVEVQLGEAAAVIRAEQFQAVANGYCRSCDFSALCPTSQRAGGLL